MKPVQSRTLHFPVGDPVRNKGKYGPCRTVRELSEMLGVSTSTIYDRLERYADTAPAPFTRGRGGGAYFNLRAFEKWWASLPALH